MAATGLILYGSSTDDSTDLPLIILAAILAVLGGANSGVEYYDHATHDHRDSENQPATSDETTLLAEAVPTDYTQSNQAISAASTSASSPRSCKSGPNLIRGAMILPAAAASYGLYNQAVKLMEESFHVASPTGYGVAPLVAIPMAVRFFYVPIKHAISQLVGNHAEFAKQVTGSKDAVTFLQSVRSRIGAFLLLCAAHFAESLLISNATNGWAGWFAAIALTLGSAFTHLGHTSALPNAYRAWCKQPVGKQLLTAALGALSGITHTAPTTLATVTFWKDANSGEKAALCLSAIMDFLLGWLEFLQHGGRRFYATPSSVTVEEEPHDSSSLFSEPA